MWEVCRRAWDRGLCRFGKVQCANRRLAHVAGDRKCPMRERQVEVARVRVVSSRSVPAHG